MPVVNKFWSKLFGVVITAVATVICLVVDEITKTH
jgi:hypothetical protein